MSEEATQDQAQTPDSISLNDLNLLRNIVDLASQRGAFRGNELTQVGTVYDKLNVFLNFVAEQQAAQAEDQEEAVDEVEEEQETIEV
jgi:hypothetical protein